MDAAALGLLFHTALSQLRPLVSGLLYRLLFPDLVYAQSGAYVIADYSIDIILYIASFFLPALFILRYSPPTKSKITYKPAFPKGFPLYLLIFLGTVSALGNLTHIFSQALRQWGISFTDYTPAVPHSPTGIVLLFVYCAFIPALAEELFFRKILLERLAGYGKLFAVLTTAAAFSLMHANPEQFLYAFGAGIILGHVTLLCGSVLPAIILHFANNTLSLSYLLIEEYAKNTPLSQITPYFDLALALVGICLLSIYWKKGYSVYKEDEPSLGFSPFEGLLGFFVLLYISYTLFLSAGWINLI